LTDWSIKYARTMSELTSRPSDKILDELRANFPILNAGIEVRAGGDVMSSLLKTIGSAHLADLPGTIQSTMRYMQDDVRSMQDQHAVQAGAITQETARQRRVDRFQASQDALQQWRQQYQRQTQPEQPQPTDRFWNGGPPSATAPQLQELPPGGYQRQPLDMGGAVRQGWQWLTGGQQQPYQPQVPGPGSSRESLMGGPTLPGQPQLSQQPGSIKATVAPDLSKLGTEAISNLSRDQLQTLVKDDVQGLGIGKSKALAIAFARAGLQMPFRLQTEVR
jgi:hypothetical protein